jgi:hypothetical protein
MMNGFPSPVGRVGGGDVPTGGLGLAGIEGVVGLVVGGTGVATGGEGAGVGDGSLGAGVVGVVGAGVVGLVGSLGVSQFPGMRAIGSSLHNS